MKSASRRGSRELGLLGICPDRHRNRDLLPSPRSSGGCEGEQLQEIVDGADHGPLGSRFSWNKN